MSLQNFSIATKGQPQPTLLTATWSADRPHFALMRASIERSSLAGLRHLVLVQTEDLPLFKEFAGGTVELLATADVLPPAVERSRASARRWVEGMGRNTQRLARSLHKRTGLPLFVPYAGWQVQQLTKLAAAALLKEGPAVVLDSDVIVTRNAKADDFTGPQVVCFERQEPEAEVVSKGRAWHVQAHRFLKLPVPFTPEIDTYFETPFVFEPALVRALQKHVEQLHGMPWHEAFLRQPVRQWSEFATYRIYLRHHPPEGGICWQPDITRRIFNASDPIMVKNDYLALTRDPDCRYVIIHSENSDRQRWSAESYAEQLMPLLSPLLCCIA